MAWRCGQAQGVLGGSGKPPASLSSLGLQRRLGAKHACPAVWNNCVSPSLSRGSLSDAACL
jgi:hypothetical protein